MTKKSTPKSDASVDQKPPAKKGMVTSTMYSRIKEIVAQGRSVQFSRRGWSSGEIEIYRREITEGGYPSWSLAYALVNEEVRSINPEDPTGWLLVRDVEGVLWFIVQQEVDCGPLQIISPLASLEEFFNYERIVTRFFLQLTQLRDQAFLEAERAQLLTMHRTVIEALKPPLLAEVP